MKRKRLIGGLAALALFVGAAAPAFAAPDFGPGNSQKGPNDGGPSATRRARPLTSPAASSRDLKEVFGMPRFLLVAVLALVAAAVAVPGRQGSPHFVGQPTITRSGDAITVAARWPAWATRPRSTWR